MSTKEQLLYSALHGIAMRYAAEKRNLAKSIEELRQIADGRNDILAEASGIEAGAWYAWPSTHAGYELVAAGMMIMAGPTRAPSQRDSGIPGRMSHLRLAPGGVSCRGAEG
jgi:hypothetical protein